LQTREGQRDVARALGCDLSKSGSLEKLRARRSAYDSFSNGMPLSYLEAIGVVPGELDACMEADLELYHVELAKPRFPREAAIRLLPAVYTRYRFPAGTSEAEALHLLATCRNAERQMLISYPELLHIWLSHGGAEPYYEYLPPVYERTGGRLVIGKGQAGYGVTRL